MKNKEIQYPCIWNYRIIGSDKDELQQAVIEIIEKSFLSTPCNTSKSGKYHSINVEVEVLHKEERDSIFAALQNDLRIKFVL